MSLNFCYARQGISGGKHVDVLLDVKSVLATRSHLFPLVAERSLAWASSNEGRS